jgi:hypothetical protein
MDASSKSQQRSLRTQFFAVLLLIITGGLTLAGLMLQISIRQPALPVEQGQVARQDLLAPNDTSYVSEVLTEQAKTEAEREVSPVYSPADPAISRQQIEGLRNSLQLISDVKGNEELDQAAKKVALADISLPQLQNESIDRILLMSDTRWTTIQQEALTVLRECAQRYARINRKHPAWSLRSSESGSHRRASQGGGRACFSVRCPKQLLQP